MGVGYALVTNIWQDGLEKFENLFYYVAAALSGDDPTPAELNGLMSAWRSALVASFQPFFPTTTVNILTRCRGWQADGSPSNYLPVETTVSVSGTRTITTRDGNAQVVIARPSLGVLTTINGAPGPLRHAYWAFGPLQAQDVDDNGFMVGTGGAPFSALASACNTTITASGPITWAPIKVSHTDAHVIKPSIHAFRPLTGVTFRSRASYRRSRNDGR